MLIKRGPPFRRPRPRALPRGEASAAPALCPCHVSTRPARTPKFIGPVVCGREALGITAGDAWLAKKGGQRNGASVGRTVLQPIRPTEARLCRRYRLRPAPVASGTVARPQVPPSHFSEAEVAEAHASARSQGVSHGEGQRARLVLLHHVQPELRSPEAAPLKVHPPGVRCRLLELQPAMQTPAA